MTIYRDLELTRTGQRQTDMLIQDLVSCGGTVTSVFYMTNGFPADQAQYWSTIYRLSFPDVDKLQKFQVRGWSTKIPPKLSAYPMEVKDDDN